MQTPKEYEKRIADLTKQRDYYKNKFVALVSWKGKDKIQITEEEDCWILEEHRKSKKSGHISTAHHKVPNQNVKDLYQIILEITNETRIRDGLRNDAVVKIIPKQMWMRLIEKHNIPILINEFSGGERRAPYYFPMYYRPMKILESLKIVDYSGNGTTKLIEEDDSFL